jgi:hypothetical protein
MLFPSLHCASSALLTAEAHLDVMGSKVNLWKSNLSECVREIERERERETEREKERQGGERESIHLRFMSLPRTFRTCQPGFIAMSLFCASLIQIGAPNSKFRVALKKLELDESGAKVLDRCE